MQIRTLLCVMFALAVFAVSPALLRAQFQEPTKEELQMTSDPNAPGAAAVYLYREEITDDNLHFHSLYVRMKILTEKGKEEATVHVPYDRTDFKVKDIHGRTIHPDGTVIPLTATPSDLTDVKTKGYQLNTMVFTLPSVEVGSIIEYRLDIRYDDNMVSSPQWDVAAKVLRAQGALHVHAAGAQLWHHQQPRRQPEPPDVVVHARPDAKVVRTAAAATPSMLTMCPRCPPMTGCRR